MGHLTETVVMGLSSEITLSWGYEFRLQMTKFIRPRSLIKRDFIPFNAGGSLRDSHKTAMHDCISNGGVGGSHVVHKFMD